MTAARAAGAVMRQNLREEKVINEAHQFDIKLELDVRCQRLIERTLRRALPEIPVLGEEGDSGDVESRLRWVVDPIDGTVNFTYGIPHCCVSIALQVRSAECGVRNVRKSKAWRGHPDAEYETVVGVVYDPFCDELWTAIRGQKALLNGTAIRVTRHTRLEEAIISMGFAKNPATLRVGLPTFNRLIRRVRKMRMMGAAALGMTYVASGRFDAYLEYGIKLWDIAAGGLILECAGGEFWHEPAGPGHTFQLKANNGRLRKAIERAA
ncbi:MAG TPA: inositol monophosphatase family protein [Verrucomicrobiae bacterium]